MHELFVSYSSELILMSAKIVFTINSWMGTFAKVFDKNKISRDNSLYRSVCCLSNQYNLNELNLVRE